MLYHNKSFTLYKIMCWKCDTDRENFLLFQHVVWNVKKNIVLIHKQVRRKYKTLEKFFLYQKQISLLLTGPWLPCNLNIHRKNFFRNCFPSVFTIYKNDITHNFSHLQLNLSWVKNQETTQKDRIILISNLQSSDAFLHTHKVCQNISSKS